jgi:hypothetical protein
MHMIARLAAIRCQTHSAQVFRHCRLSQSQDLGPYVHAQHGTFASRKWYESTTCQGTPVAAGISSIPIAGKGEDLARLKPLHTLERSIGQQLGRDSRLWDTYCFNVSVYPDLPVIMKWFDMLQLPQR